MTDRSQSTLVIADEPKIYKPFLLEDDRGFTKVQNCSICHKHFNVLLIEHKCKRCLRSVCVDCGKKKAMIYKQNGTKKEHRICSICEQEYTLIEQYREKYKLSFGTDSDFSGMWIKKLNKEKKSYSQILTEYTECLSVTNESVLKFKRESKTILAELFPSYNYSFRNFVASIRSNSDDFEEKLVNVGVAVLGRLPGLLFFPEFIYVVVFFLSFASEAHAFLIITNLIEKVFPLYQNIKKLKRENLLGRQLKVMVKMTEVLAATTNKDDIIMVKQYLEARMSKFLASLTINVYSFEVSLHIIHETIMKSNHLELYKGVTSVTFLCKSEIANRRTYDQIELTMLRSVSLEQIKGLMAKFEKAQLDYDVNGEVYESQEFQRVSKQCKLLQTSCSALETELTRKNDQLKQLGSDLREKSAAFQDSQRKVDNLEQQVFFLSEKRKQINRYEELLKANNENLATVDRLQKQNSYLQEQIRTEMKRAFMNNDRLRWLQRTNEQYEQQLNQLRSANEILQVKVEAKNIEFNTDRIENQLREKNTRIKLLENKVRELELELAFQKQNPPTSPKTSSQANETVRQRKATTVEESNIRQYEQQLELGSKIINKQKTAISDLTGQLAATKQQLKQSEQTSSFRQQRIKALEETLGQYLKFKEGNNFNADQPEELTTLDQEISRQQDLIRRNSLIGIRNRFNECLNELKIRQLDCRIKSQKLLAKQQQLKQCRKVNFTAEVVEAELVRQLQHTKPSESKPDECRTF